jgi:hypothetical protein
MISDELEPNLEKACYKHATNAQILLKKAKVLPSKPVMLSF